MRAIAKKLVRIYGFLQNNKKNLFHSLSLHMPFLINLHINAIIRETKSINKTLKKTESKQIEKQRENVNKLCQEL